MKRLFSMPIFASDSNPVKMQLNYIHIFIETHARAVLFIDADPSSVLKNQIATAQKQMKAKKDTTMITTVSFNCSQCMKKFKSADARISHFNAKHSGSTLCTASKLLNPRDNQTMTTQK
jgi:hypothetical protein